MVMPMTDRVAFELPGVRLVGAKNDRSHWRKRAERVRGQRHAAKVYAQAAGVHLMPLPMVVTITRRGPGQLDDDNLTISASSVRDGIADAMALPKHDRDPRVTWVVNQERRATWSVLVEVFCPPATRERVTARDASDAADAKNGAIA